MARHRRGPSYTHFHVHVSIHTHVYTHPRARACRRCVRWHGRPRSWVSATPVIMRTRGSVSAASRHRRRHVDCAGTGVPAAVPRYSRYRATVVMMSAPPVIMRIDMSKRVHAVKKSTGASRTNALDRPSAMPMPKKMQEALSAVEAEVMGGRRHTSLHAC